MNNHYSVVPLINGEIRPNEFVEQKHLYLFFKDALYFFSSTAFWHFSNKQTIFKEGQEDLFVAVWNLAVLKGETDYLKGIINRTNIEVIGDNLIET